MTVHVSTPSRLHFGIIDMRGDLGRIHSSVGVAIQEPRLILCVEKSTENLIQGARTNRAKEILERLQSDHKVETSVHLKIIQDIPEHSGFGSGTQLALAIGTALNKLFNLNISTEATAVNLERSRVSGIGTHVFQYGGFIIDGGHKTLNRDAVPPLIFRRDFPDDWFFVVCVPHIDKGFSGEQEQNAFKVLVPPPPHLVSEVSRLVLMQMIPSIIDKDITLFGDAMTKLDTTFGDYWKEIQGGTYTHIRIEECVNHLLKKGAYGAGQSSWGPAIYGLADGKSHARQLADEMLNFINQKDCSGEVMITPADNKGAQITIEKM